LASIYSSLKRILRTRFGVHFYRRGTPWGLSLANDLRRIDPSFKARVIFDVGANVGQTALQMHKMFPLAVIQSFEPVASTFDEFRRNCDGVSRIVPHRLACGSRSGVARMQVAHNSELSRLCTDDSAEPATVRLEEVPVTTIDEFCRANDIARIDILKTDTEGHELEVFRGASQTLSNAGISYIFTEATMPSRRGPHPQLSICDVAAFLSGFGYECVGLYDQVFWPEASLYYCNALFRRQSANLPA
jgi:FkbM family methyltransferase